jgi:hypothetical protein
MDPVEMVVSALVTGAATGATDVASSAISDSYHALKALVLKCLHRGGVGAEQGAELLAGAADGPAASTGLAGELQRIGLDEATIEAARLLTELAQGRVAKYTVDASQAKGLIVGDHGTQHNTFN